MFSRFKPTHILWVSLPVFDKICREFCQDGSTGDIRLSLISRIERLLAVKIPRAHARMTPILMPIKDKFATYALKDSLSASLPKKKKERHWKARHVTCRSTSVGRRAALAY